MTPTRSREMPPGVLMLARGKHRGPEDGSCLMEYVSVLAGRSFTDRPRSTHPLLSWLARRVNDEVDDVVRAQLAGLAPALIGTRLRRPRCRGLVRAVIYDELARAALTAAPHDGWLRDLRALALAHLAHVVGTAPVDTTCRPEMPARRRPLGTIDRNLAFDAACDALAGLEPGLRDRLLCAALVGSIARTRQGLGVADIDVVPLGPEPHAAPAAPLR